MYKKIVNKTHVYYNTKFIEKNNKKIEILIDISGEGWSLAYSFLTVNDRVIKKVPNSTTYFLTKKEFKEELNIDYAKDLYSKLNNDFDQLVALF